MRGFGSLGIIDSLLAGVFGLSPGILHLAFSLLCSALNLRVGVARPFARLTLDASCYVLDFSFDAILGITWSPRSPETRSGRRIRYAIFCRLG